MNENNHSTTDADMEPDSGNAAHATHSTPRISAPCSVVVTHVRSRLADPDGLSVKAVLDGIVQAGILANDSAKQITEIRNRQVKGDPEITIIELKEEQS